MASACSCGCPAPAALPAPGLIVRAEERQQWRRGGEVGPRGDCIPQAALAHRLPRRHHLRCQPVQEANALGNPKP